MSSSVLLGDVRISVLNASVTGNSQRQRHLSVTCVWLPPRGCCERWICPSPLHVACCFGAQAQRTGLLRTSFTDLCTLLLMLTLTKHTLVAGASPPTSAAPWPVPVFAPSTQLLLVPPSLLCCSQDLFHAGRILRRRTAYNWLSSSESLSRGLRSTRNVFVGVISPVRCSDGNETSGCSFSL